MWASPPTPITRWAPCRGGCPHPPAPKTEQAEGADHRQWPEGRATMKVAPTSGTPCGRGGLYGRPDPRRSPTKWVRRGGGGATERVSVPVYGDAKDVQFAPTRKKVEALSGKIVKVSGPLVVATGLKDANMADVVRVGEQRLIGEILNMNGDAASIQVYEETSGLGPGAVVETTGAPMSVELGPGIIENIYDGIQRPLEGIMRKAGNNNLPRGVEVPALDREKKWDFTAVARPGDKVTGGDVLGTVQETSVVLHKIMVLLPGAGHGGGAGGREGGEARADHGAEVARPRGAALQAQVSPQDPAALRPAHRGRHVPRGQGRHRRHPRALRLGQDGDAAPAGQVVGRGHRGLHRLRRTGQRDDRRAAGVPRAGGPPHRRVPDEADGSDRQHLRHAGGRP